MDPEVAVRTGALTPEGWMRRAPFPFSRWTRDRDARAPAAEPFHKAVGPSRTADIEPRMILGVHAPRSLDVIVFG